MEGVTTKLPPLILRGNTRGINSCVFGAITQSLKVVAIEEQRNYCFLPNLHNSLFFVVGSGVATLLLLGLVIYSSMQADRQNLLIPEAAPAEFWNQSK
jgi:hypothetical protein